MRTYSEETCIEEESALKDHIFRGVKWQTQEGYTKHRSCR